MGSEMCIRDRPLIASNVPLIISLPLALLIVKLALLEVSVLKEITLVQDAMSVVTVA